jgi:hypothetical protein
VACSPQANYTDRATAACPIIAVQIFLTEHFTNKVRIKYSDKGEKRRKEESVNERRNVE